MFSARYLFNPSNVGAGMRKIQAWCAAWNSQHVWGQLAWRTKIEQVFERARQELSARLPEAFGYRSRCRQGSPRTSRELSARAAPGCHAAIAPIADFRPPVGPRERVAGPGGDVRRDWIGACRGSSTPPGRLVVSHERESAFEASRSVCRSRYTAAGVIVIVASLLTWELKLLRLAVRRFGGLAMSLPLTFMTLMTGATKSVSVCGINSAAAARPSAGGSRLGLILYVVGLYLGALALVLAVQASGQLFASLTALDAGTRRIAAALMAIALAGIELYRGPAALPHIAWAVPNAWAAALRSEPFLLVFGLIRGVCIFNHSPFASMHAWLAVVFLLPSELESQWIAAALALGLALWSIAYAFRWLFRRNLADAVIGRLTSTALSSSRLVAVVDAIALIVVSIGILWS